MKKTILALAILAAGISVNAAEAAKSALAVTLDTTYVSDYIFRGVKLADASIQPSLEASYGNAYAGVWYTDALSNKATSSEADLYAGYNLAINETFAADLGVTRYTYNGGGQDDTTEVFAGVKAANLLLSPSLYYYYDFDQNVSSYIGSVGHSFPIAKVGVSVNLSATLGYVQRPGNDQDYTYWGVGAAVPYKLSETATLTAAINYTSLDRSNFNPDQDQVVFSLGLAIGF